MMTNITPNLPAYFRTRNGFPIATVTITLHPDRDVGIIIEKLKVYYDPEGGPLESDAFYANRYPDRPGYTRCLLIKDCFAGEETRKVFTRLHEGVFSETLHCAESEMHTCVRYLVDQAKQGLQDYISHLRELLEKWQNADPFSGGIMY